MKYTKEERAKIEADFYTKFGIATSDNLFPSLIDIILKLENKIDNLNERIEKLENKKNSTVSKNDEDGPYEDERFCHHCKKTTNHKCRDSGHERDSSSDYQECLECHWWQLGIMRWDEYHPPLDFQGV